MSEYPLLGSIDPHHQRIGYVTALCLVSTRDYASRDALTSRLKETLFQKIYADEDLFRALLDRVPADRREEILKRAKDNAENSDLSPASILAAPDRQHAWLTLNTFWLNDAGMPSSLGELAENKTFRIVDFARMLGVLLPGYDLSEIGFLIKYLVEEPKSGISPETMFNPLLPNCRSCLPVLYLRLLLESDVLFPFLIRELVCRHETHSRMYTRGEEGVLLTAVDTFLNTVGTVMHPDEVLAIQNITAYRRAIAANQSTQENYLRPRLELLIDTGYLGRHKGAVQGKGAFVWRVTEATVALSRELEILVREPKRRDTFLDSSYFGCVARSLTVPFRTMHKQEEALLYFAKALMLVKREFGFTPGRTAALLACLLAWEDRNVIEVQQVFDAVYFAAKSELNKYLHFSGGSRFDQEFLIRVDDDLVTILENSLQHGR